MNSNFKEIILNMMIIDKENLFMINLNSFELLFFILSILFI
jgi:hypothetical protein